MGCLGKSLTTRCVLRFARAPSPWDRPLDLESKIPSRRRRSSHSPDGSGMSRSPRRPTRTPTAGRLPARPQYASGGNARVCTLRRPATNAARPPAARLRTKGRCMDDGRRQLPAWLGARGTFSERPVRPSTVRRPADLRRQSPCCLAPVENRASGNPRAAFRQDARSAPAQATSPRPRASASRIRSGGRGCPSLS